MTDEFDIETLLSRIDGPRAPDVDLEDRIWAKVEPHLGEGVPDRSTAPLVALARRGEVGRVLGFMTRSRVWAAAVLVVVVALAALVLWPQDHPAGEEQVQRSPVERIDRACIDSRIAIAAEDLAASSLADGRPPAATLVTAVEADIEAVLAVVRDVESGVQAEESDLASVGDRLTTAAELARLAERQRNAGDLIAARSTTDALSATLAGSLDSLAALGAPSCARPPSPGG